MRRKTVLLFLIISFPSSVVHIFTFDFLSPTFPTFPTSHPISKSKNTLIPVPRRPGPRWRRSSAKTGLPSYRCYLNYRALGLPPCRRRPSCCCFRRTPWGHWWTSKSEILFPRTRRKRGSALSDPANLCVWLCSCSQTGSVLHTVWLPRTCSASQPLSKSFAVSRHTPWGRTTLSRSAAPGQTPGSRSPTSAGLSARGTPALWTAPSPGTASRWKTWVSLFLKILMV